MEDEAENSFMVGPDALLHKITQAVKPTALPDTQLIFPDAIPRCAFLYMISTALAVSIQHPLGRE